MNALADKLKKNSSIKETALLRKSKIFGHKDMITTQVPMINVALSGDPDGGMTSGITVLAGPSKHFKTLFALLLGAPYLKKYEDGVILLYDSEFGSPLKYFDGLGIDTERVIHSPMTDIEELKSDIMIQLKGLNRGDHVCIIIDSVGNLASKKEVEDALEEKVVVDMTRAKAMKSLFRMITPHLTIKDLPLIAINHTYVELKQYGKTIVSGGTGITYSADNIWIIGRQQDKDGKDDLAGYNFVINIEKSRFVKEKAKIPITVSFDAGINRWSGLLDNALEANLLTKVMPKKYSKVDENGEIGEEIYKEDDIISDGPFWTDMLENTTLKSFLLSLIHI